MAMDFLEGVTESIDRMASMVTGTAGSLDGHRMSMRPPVEALQASWLSTARPHFDSVTAELDSSLAALRDALHKHAGHATHSARLYTAADDTARSAVSSAASAASDIPTALRG
jgi:WXG100 family type VII secretion target